MNRKKLRNRNIKDEDRLTDTGALSRGDRNKADSRTRRDCFRSSANDPAWYAHTPQMLTDYASFPYSWPLGTLLPKSVGSWNQGAGTPDQQAIAGILALYYEPTIGRVMKETDAVNVAMRNIYAYVRHANSGHANYEAPDLMLYLLAMDSVYMFHSYLKRVLGVLLDYTPTNRYYPEALLKAMRVTPNIRNSIADLRGYINQYAVKMGSLCVPNSMSYMARHSWMTEGLYTDGPAAKAQTYLYVPSSYYQFTLDSNNVGSLNRIRLFTDPANEGAVTFNGLNELIAFGDSLLNPLITNEDINIMSGDILKAFGPEGVVKVQGVLDGYMVLPVYNREVLSQIENATIFHGSLTGSINQNTEIGGGYLVANDAFVQRPIRSMSATADMVKEKAVAPYSQAKVLNMHVEHPTPADAMVATRLMGFADFLEASSDNNWSLTLTAYGSEIITCAKLFQFHLQPNGTQTLVENQLATAMIQEVPTNFMNMSVGHMIGIVASLSSFDWAPAVQVVTPVANDEGYHQSGPFIDFETWTVLDQANVENLHNVALLSEFSVPQMGSFADKL
nr:putative capsid [Marmot picobirnavirus]